MRTGLLFTSIMLVTSLFSNAPAEETKKGIPVPEIVQPTQRQILQNKYIDFLKKEGFAPQVDQDGDILFKFEGYSFYIQVSDDDAQFFRVMLPNIWPINSAEEMNRVLVAADYSNSLSKTAKVFIVRNDVWITAELLIENPDAYEKVFLRALRMIQGARYNFELKMNELSKPKTGAGQGTSPSSEHAKL